MLQSRLNYLPRWVRYLGAGALYVLLGVLVHGLYPGGVALVLPELAQGLALAALMIGGSRYLAAIVPGAIVLAVLTQGSPQAMIGYALTDVTEVYVGYRLLTLRGMPDWRTFTSYMRLMVLGGGVASLVGAGVGTGVMVLLGEHGMDHGGGYFLRFWLSDALGIVLLTPLILAWCEHSVALSTRLQQRPAETLLALSATFVLGQFVFLGWFSQPAIAPLAKGFLMFLPVSWVAIRLGRRGVTVVLMLIAIQALTGAFLERGYFAKDMAQTGLENYCIYLLTLAVVGLALAAYVRDMEQVLAELAIKDSALTAAANGVVITDPDGRVRWANPAFTALTGYSLAEAVGRTPGVLTKSGKQDAHYYAQMWQTILDKRVWRGELVNRRKDGTLYDEELVITPIVDGRGRITNFVAIKQDISQRKQLEQQVRELVFHDPLTQLPNRRLLSDRMEQVLASCRRGLHRAAVIVLDLDNFKTLNDCYGHAAGDALLVEVASRLKQAVREIDTVARLGGDEFVVLLDQLDADPDQAREQARLVGLKISAALARPYQLRLGGPDGDVAFQCTASLGLVLLARSTLSIDQALRQADQAMYQAKREGRDRFCFYDPPVDPGSAVE